MIRNLSIHRASIAGRLIGFSVLFALAALAAASVALWLVVANVVREQVDQRLDLQITALQNALIVSPDGSLSLSTSLDGPPFDRPRSGWNWQVTRDDQRLSSTSLAARAISAPSRPVDWRRMVDGKPQPADGDDGDGRKLHFRVLQTVIDGRPVEILATAPAAALRTPAIRALVYLMPVMVALGALLTMGIVLQVRYGLRPLRQMTTQIADISSGRIADMQSPQVDELRPVADEINRLVTRNRERLAETRIQFANLAHGLKTPVASLHLALNNPSGADEKAARLHLDQIDRRIRHHLSRARAGTADAGLGSRTALRPHLDNILMMMTKLYAEKGIEVVNTVDAGISLNCAPEDVEEIMGSIIDNAFKWAGARIRISAERENGMVVTRVEDDGPGIESDQMASVLAPGVRLDETVSGHGFGLSIASELSALYGGGIELEPASPHGLTVRIRLPAHIA
jgi:signal transduction histidine kinase